MYICKNCGKEISESSVFCRFCGTPLEKKLNTAVPVEESQKEFEALSLKLKQTCDEMVTTFVSKLNGTDVQLAELEKNAGTKDTEIGRLKELLDSKEKSLADCQAQIQNLRTELNKANTRVKELTEKLSSQSVQNNAADDDLNLGEAKTVSIRSVRAQENTLEIPVMSASGAVCPTCGEPLEEGAVFCANCGSKVVKPQPALTPAPSLAVSGKVCPTCGAQVDSETVFCTNCGTKLK